MTPNERIAEEIKKEFVRLNIAHPGFQGQYDTLNLENCLKEIPRHVSRGN